MNEKEFITGMGEDQVLYHFGQILKIPDVKSLMIELFISNILNVIDINRGQLQQNKFCKKLETKFKLFEWPLKQFEQRISMSDIYLNLLRFEEPRCLNTSKFLADLNNLESLVHEILNSSNRALDSLKDCKRKLRMEEDLTQELENNRRVFAKQNDDLKSFLSYEQDVQKMRKDNFNNLVDSVVDDVFIIDPIIIRHSTTVIRGQHEEFQDMLEGNRIELERAIQDYITRFAQAEQVHEQTMTFLNIQTESLRHKVNYWSKKYEDDYEQYSFKNTGLKLTVRAMESNYETLRNRLQGFRLELARLGSVHAEKSAQKEIQAKKKEAKYKPLKSKFKLTKSQKALGKKMGKNITAF